jgi:fructose-1,6-bisphosphatase II / sedoheptulose-1,7-bisphosphatase
VSLSKKLICQEVSNLILEASEFSAIKASELVGSGRKNDADDLAVKAMREVLQNSRFGMEVVIGEGEMDEAPMLFIGERFGEGELLFDIAVDPLEGTNLCAKNMPNSITTIAISDKGGFLKAPDCYMKKLASGRVKEDGVLHIEASLKENLKNLAQYQKKDMRNISVIMLDRERHFAEMEEARSLGVKVSLIPDGDIYGVIATTSFGNGADLYVGSGGAPEGVLSAVAIKACKGFMMAKLMPETDEQKQRILNYGLKLDEILTLNSLVKGDAIFCASGVTNGEMLRGAKLCKKRDMWMTESIIFSTISGVGNVKKVLNYLDL